MYKIDVVLDLLHGYSHRLCLHFGPCCPYSDVGASVATPSSAGVNLADFPLQARKVSYVDLCIIKDKFPHTWPREACLRSLWQVLNTPRRTAQALQLIHEDKLGPKGGTSCQDRLQHVFDLRSLNSVMLPPVKLSPDLSLRQWYWMLMDDRHGSSRLCSTNVRKEIACDVTGARERDLCAHISAKYERKMTSCCIVRGQKTKSGMQVRGWHRSAELHVGKKRYPGTDG